MWKWLDSLGDFAVTNARVVRDAWGAFMVWCAVACVAIWWVVGAVYDARLANDQSSISTLNVELSASKDEAQDLRSKLAARPDRPDRWSEEYEPIPSAQFKSLSEKLKPLVRPSQTVSVGYVDNPSAVSLSEKFAETLKGLGIQSQRVLNPDDDPKAHGLTIFIRNPTHISQDDQKLIDAFRVSGFVIKVDDLGTEQAPATPFAIQVSYPQ